MNIRMPGPDGIHATPGLETVRSWCWPLTTPTQTSSDALTAGVSGFLLKDAGPAELPHAVWVVADGEALPAPHPPIPRRPPASPDRPGLSGTGLRNRGGVEDHGGPATASSANQRSSTPDTSPPRGSRQQPARSPAVVGTVRAIQRELCHDGFLLRYHSESENVQRHRLVHQHRDGPVADAAAGTGPLHDGLRGPVPRPSTRLHLRSRRARPRRAAGDAHRAGPVPHGDHLHLAAGRRTPDPDEPAQPRRAGRARQGHRAGPGGGNAPGEHPNQQWNVNANRTITGVQSGLCLDANGAATSNGTKIILWSCNGAANQQWRLNA